MATSSAFRHSRHYWHTNGAIGIPGGGAHRVEPAPPSQPRTPASMAAGGRQASHRLMTGAPPKPAVRQNGVAPGQSVLARHSTQAFVTVSQMGVPPSIGHCAFVVQPGLHAPARQTGPAAEVVQSLSAMHSTQRLVVSLQRRCGPASPALQLVVLTHCTHCWVVMSQTGRRMGPPASGAHSWSLVHPTHAPVAVSQWSSGPTHAIPPSPAQEAWHVWLLGQQTGVDVPAQSALVAHATHVPARQTLVALGHSAFVRQSTHPAGTPGAVHRTPASWPPASWPPLPLPPS